MNHVQSPATGDSAIEQEIQAKGKTAPRVTPADLQANIASEHYFTAQQGVLGEIRDGGTGGTYAGDHEVPVSIQALSLLTFCVLVLRNGFTVTGESACASPENFDAEIGRKIARQNAEQKVWPLMGYELKEQLFQHAETIRRVKGD
ncbi:MAG: Gp49 family protein [Pseudomonadota bacterium]